MKKYERILAALLSATLICSFAAVYAQDTEIPDTSAQTEAASESEQPAAEEYDIPEKVEIIFSVGDDTLLINGESVKVETAPYVVGEGTTLVPVRVITEAFGAKVGWDGDTRTVTLNYPDVNIVLQIGNPIAEVNGEAVTLLAAPELPDGRTMVPLRFISENFGADVGYDEETRGISVIKETVPEGETVEGVVDTKYIGDSFYGWTMENPKDLTLYERDFDGTYTAFDDEEANDISVSIYEKEKDFDFEDEFKYNKEYYTSFATLVKAEKNTDNENVSTILINARTSTTFIYSKTYVTDKYIYIVDVYVDNVDEVKNKFVALAESFTLGFSETDIHDLSNLENGMRRFESEDMNFSLLIPANMSGGEHLLKVNEFTFFANGDERTSVNLEIVSKSEAVKTAVGYVERDMENSTRGINTDIVRYTPLEQKTYGDLTVYEYDLIISGSKSSDCIVRFLSFELGEYIYKLNLIADGDAETPPETVIESILAGMSFGEIDPEKAGIIMDSVDPDEGKEEGVLKVGALKFKTPAYYTEYDSSESELIDDTRSILILGSSQVLPSGYSLKNYVDAFRLSLKNDADSAEDSKMTVGEVKNVSINNKRFYKLSIVTEETTLAICDDVYFYETDGIIYMFMITMPEYYYSKETITEFENILKTMEK